MPYKVLRFKMSHLEDFKPRKEQIVDLEAFRECKITRESWIRRFESFTLFYEDKPIMIYGFMSGGYGTYYPVILSSEDIDKHRFAVIRCLYDCAEKYVGSDVRRFEAYVNAEDKKANRFARYFGFEPVGIRRQASVDGKDQIIYERLWRK